MNVQRHRALIVEDDGEVAADLVGVLNDCGCDATITTNRHDALVQLSNNSFCLVLLDLKIGSEPDSIRGEVEYGMAVLEEVRRVRERSKATLPVVVISGHASEREFAVRVMRNGASDVVQKLESAKEKADRIYRALESAGRTSHPRCIELERNAPPACQAAGLVLSIPGDREGRRAIVTLNEHRAAIPMVPLKVLLQLVLAKLRGTRVHKIDLGGDPAKGFKPISILRAELRQAYRGDMKRLIFNDQQGNYSLADEVEIGRVNAARLATYEEATVTRLSQEIAELLSNKFPGNS